MSEAETEEVVETKPVTWRMPVWVKEEFAGDWSGFREILEEWAESGEELEVEVPETSTSVCMSMPIPLLEALEEEAKRLNKQTGRKWTAGKVARKIYEDRYEKAS